MGLKTPARVIASEDIERVEVPFENVLNFRDVGEFVNRAIGAKYNHP